MGRTRTAIVAGLLALLTAVSADAATFAPFRASWFPTSACAWGNMRGLEGAYAVGLAGWTRRASLGLSPCAPIVALTPPAELGWRQSADYGEAIADWLHAELSRFPEEPEPLVWAGEQSSFSWGVLVASMGLQISDPAHTLPDPLYDAQASFSRRFRRVLVAPYVFSWPWRDGEAYVNDAAQIGRDIGAAVHFARVLRDKHPEVERVVWQLSNGFADPWRGDADERLWWVALPARLLKRDLGWYDVVAWWLARASEANGWPVEFQIELFRGSMNHAEADPEATVAALDSAPDVLLSAFSHPALLALERQGF